MTYKILIVDDENIVALNYKQFLKSFGYDVVGVANTGEAALLKVAELKPDLVLMDIILKGDMDGIEAATKINTKFDIPVVYITAHSGDSILARAKLSSPYGYILKPVNKLELKNTLELALHKHEYESKLKDSEKRYRKLIEAVPAAVFTINIQKRVTYVSNHTIKLLGYNKPDELIGKNVLEKIVAPEDHENAFKNFEKLLENGYNIIEELNILKKDGSKFIGELNASLLKNSEGIPKNIIVTIKDISKRKKAEKELKLANLYNRSLIEASLDPLVTIGPDGRIMDVNTATELVTGYTRNKLIGTDFSNYFTEPDKAKEGYEKVFKKGFVRDYPLEIKNIDGSVISVLYNASTYKDESDNVIGVFAAARDVTERNINENAIIQAKEEWEQTFDAVPDLITIVDTDFKITQVNKAMASKLGLKPEKAVGINYYKAVHGSNELLSFVPYLKLLEDDKEQISMFQEDQLVENFMMSVSPLYDSEKNLRGCVHVARDISKRINAENEVKKSLKEKELLLKEIHHRVKNNLQIIYSLHELQEIFVKDENTSMITFLRESKNRILSMAMIHEMLYQSKDLSSINFVDYIKNLVGNLFHIYGLNQNITTIFDLEDFYPNIETSIPLGLIINELVSNSIKYAFPNNEPGEISISLNSYDKGFQLIISDNGIGLPEEVDFKNREQSLGLNLVTSLTQQLDGTIDLDRSQGTKYIINFNELKYKERY